ncbi:PstS family phosphate ABC transporter substrate-binding protein [Paenimyroides baculatum]|uniref:Phosphate ABC transporter substrate-binding protein, PhoT family n=1 Tax=Paenimyroides baculatum TaxID=2608000 RepID=A0A5M6CVF6_9FLAO|nr:substrate-binding domain-containing protein [Paenimyroides baculatum]KAA5538360.1 phosphate ABC transporter substrate-binding protein, PhoT family [Paenimyroides baculatum]
MKQIIWSVLGLSLLISCKKEPAASTAEVKEAYDRGTTEMYVESSVYPIVEDINEVFKTYYNDADIKLKMLSQNEILNAVYKDSNRLVIMPKTFSAKELEAFKGRVVPKITPIAKDAVLFITQKNATDTLINYNDVIAVFKGAKKSEKVFVFHDANSNIVEKIKTDAGVSELSKNVYYAKTVEEIVSYINKNKNAVGVVGINWMLQPDAKIKEGIKQLRSMLVYNDSLKNYYAPSQSTIADNTYPLIRTINIIDVQGKTGLGTGFASFAASDKGQRIVLKSGLMPVTLPKREINIVE